MGILRQMESGVLVSKLCREYGMSSATVYSLRSSRVGWTPQPYQ